MPGVGLAKRAGHCISFMESVLFCFTPEPNRHCWPWGPSVPPGVFRPLYLKVEGQVKHLKDQGLELRCDAGEAEGGAEVGP